MGYCVSQSFPDGSGWQAGQFVAIRSDDYQVEAELLFDQGGCPADLLSWGARNHQSPVMFLCSVLESEDLDVTLSNRMRSLWDKVQGTCESESNPLTSAARQLALLKNVHKVRRLQRIADSEGFAKLGGKGRINIVN